MGHGVSKPRHTHKDIATLDTTGPLVDRYVRSVERRNRDGVSKRLKFAICNRIKVYNVFCLRRINNKLNVYYIGHLIHVEGCHTYTCFNTDISRKYITRTKTQLQEIGLARTVNNSKKCPIVIGNAFKLYTKPC